MMRPPWLARVIETIVAGTEKGVAHAFHPQSAIRNPQLARATLG